MGILREYPESLVIATVAHVGLAAGLILGVSLGSSPLPQSPSPGRDPMQAVALNEQEVETAMKALERQEHADESAAIKRQQELQKQVEQLESQKARQAERVERLRQEREQQAEKVADLRQSTEQSQKAKQEVTQELEKLTAQRQALQTERKQLEQRYAQLSQKTESEQQGVDELQALRDKLIRQQQELADARQQQQEKLEQLSQQRREAEAAAAAAREQAAAAQRRAEAAHEAQAEAQRRAEKEAQAAAERARERRLDDMRAIYKASIKRYVQNNWRQPPSFSGSETAQVQVTQIPSGDVTQVRLVDCTGSSAFCESVVAAVKRASPLPKAPDPDVFEREIQFLFDPESS